MFKPGDRVKVKAGWCPEGLDAVVIRDTGWKGGGIEFYVELDISRVQRDHDYRYLVVDQMELLVPFKSGPLPLPG